MLVFVAWLHYTTTMNIFFSGIGGVGIGPLAQLAHDAGYDVLGSDSHESLTTDSLAEQGIPIHIGQDPNWLEVQNSLKPIDWFVYTAALPDDHPELVTAKKLGIVCTKRDELLSKILAEKNLKLLAVSGTHGKTTTTGMLIWAFKQLHIPVSYSIGTTISFGSSGHYEPGSEYFVYECDEFDRNFLHFSPFLSLVTSLGYDHPDTYPSKQDYNQAFGDFVNQSHHTIGWQHDLKQLPNLPEDTTWQLGDNEMAAVNLPGEHNRRNATLVLKALEYLGFDDSPSLLETFPGTNRRFEKLADNLYSDYGHHPTEIAATLQMAREISDRVVLVYQPHQNVRQHEIKNLYRNSFTDANTIYWLPTYLSRENPDLPILSSAELTENISNKDDIELVDLNDELWHTIQSHRQNGHLVLCMGAGTIDRWLREQL